MASANLTRASSPTVEMSAGTGESKCSVQYGASGRMTGARMLTRSSGVVLPRMALARLWMRRPVAGTEAAMLGARSESEEAEQRLDRGRNR